MIRFWPRRANGLPPGQRLLREMPRFTDTPLRPPPEAAPLHLSISVDRQIVAEFTAADLDALGPADHRADFHCVTTWSVKNLTWTGVPLERVVASVGLDARTAPYLIARSADRRRGHFLTVDALAPDVILATHLDGVALGGRHGGPLRLVAPAHYGYKSVKHLVGIDLRQDAPRRLGKEHLRGRVEQQERHPTLPSWLVKYPYRAMIPPTALLAERSLRKEPVMRPRAASRASRRRGLPSADR